MKIFCPLTAVFCVSLALFSCAGIPARKPGAAELPPVTVRPASPETIMGSGLVPEKKLAAFVERNNSGIDRDFIRSLVQYYVEESAAEGVNHDIAFAQMCLETGFLRYGGLVTPDMNNFCGLGAIGPEKPGEVFPDARTGVRAHIQHLKAYASEEPLEQELVDPRFRYVKRGRSPTIQGLAGTWATDQLYSEKIAGILDRLYDFSFLEN
ncbi:MAG: glucosaminidase domain-containing protein [Treponema sp.]|jgi:hypothetical protein|nr:glucosaminidase domain-containing protein [Treponema sp.]